VTLPLSVLGETPLVRFGLETLFGETTFNETSFDETSFGEASFGKLTNMYAHEPNVMMIFQAFSPEKIVKR
jgi:hypothetical protein